MKIFTIVFILTFFLICTNVNAQQFIEQNNKVKLYSLEYTSDDKLSNTLTLDQNYPNPFDAVTTIEFSLPNTGMVALNIYNILGKEIVKLVNRELTKGKYRVVWDTRSLAEGTYFYRLQSGENVKSRILHKNNN